MKSFPLLLFASICAGCASAANDTTLYAEKYRPQYHFTPAHRWIGDPCGTIVHNGKYLAYSWGGAESTDLIHWTETSNHAIEGVPRNIATFTGSVVVDKNNTAGYGHNALIAAFTSFDENSKKQSQSIAFSRDDGKSFRYYDLNPVLDIWSTEFRDPTVIWDEQRGRWVMLIAKALEKKVAFYSSPNLKDWTWMSDFGPMGDSERSWECPDMFQLPVEGTDRKKWVLNLSVNWAREQYFTGEFDGDSFIADAPDSLPLYVDEGLDYYASRVFQSADNPATDSVYSIAWVNTWDYANAAPSTWGKGVWSVPRRLTLYHTPGGLRMRQLPVENLATLRGKPAQYNLKLKPGTTPLKAVASMGNVYEMILTLSSSADDIAGVNLCVGDGRKLTIAYDSHSRYLTIDRTGCTDADIPKFDRMAWCRIPGNSDELNLQILVDKSTVEIFANNGEKTFSLLTYPGENQTAAEMFSLHGVTKARATVYPLRSIFAHK